MLDTIGGDTLERSWRVLRRDGVLVTIASDVPAETAAHYGVRGIFFIVQPSRTELVQIANLLDQDAIRPFVSAVLPLEQARRLFEQGAAGHTRGKLVLQVVNEQLEAAA